MRVPEADPQAVQPLARTLQWLLRAEGAHGHGAEPIGAAQAEGLRMLVTSGRPAAYLDAQLFGRALAGQLKAMEAAGAEARRFLFEMGALWLGMELRVTVTPQGRHYGVELCDALDPHVDHVRSASVRDLDALAAWPLSHWLPAARMRDCIARMTRPPIGILWPWTPAPADAGRGSEAQRLHFADPVAARRGVASLTLEAGDVDSAQRSLDEVLQDLTREADDASTGALDSLARMVRDGFWRAMKSGRTAVAQKYIQRVLDLPLQPRAEPTRVALLRGNVFDIAGSRVVASGVAAALRCGSWQTAAAFARMVASSPALRATDKAALLLAHDEEDAAGRPCGRPALHAVTRQGRGGSEDLVTASMRHDAIYHYVAQVVKSRGLDEHERRTICAARHGGRTAAQEALHGGHAFAAAAMLCAVLENAAAPEMAWALVAALGVEIDAVLDALDSLRGAVAHDAACWTARLIAARHTMLPDAGTSGLDGCGWPEAVAPARRKPPVAGPGRPGPARDNAPLPEPQPQASIAEVRQWVHGSDFYDTDLGRDTLVHEARGDTLYVPCVDRFPHLRIDHDSVTWARSEAEVCIELVRGPCVHAQRLARALQESRDLGMQQLLRYLSVHAAEDAAPR